MTGPARWSARIDVRWHPILTFARRRNALLDWLESNVDPWAFAETDDSLGFAPTSDRERITVSRDAGTIELRAPDAATTNLRQGMEGVFATLEPRHVDVKTYRGHWSVPIDRPYDETRQALASRLIPAVLPSLSGTTVLDGAYLIDATTPFGAAHFDFGIVDDTELAERVRAGEFSRVTGPLPSLSRRYDAMYPPCSLYVDLNMDLDFGGQVYSGTELLNRLQTLENQITIFVEDLLGSVG